MEESFVAQTAASALRLEGRPVSLKAADMSIWLKTFCFALALGTSLLSTLWQMRDIPSPYYSDRVVACLTLVLVTTTIALVYRRQSWPVWFIACTLIGLVGSLIYFQRIYYPPQITFPLPPLFDIHHSWVPGAYFAFAYAALAAAAWLEFVTSSESYAQYRSANRILLAVAVLVLLSIGYAWSAFDNTIVNILQSSESRDAKLARLAPYVKVGDDFKAFRSRVRDYATEDLRLDYRVFHYTFPKIGLEVVTMSDGKVYAIGHRQTKGSEWLVRPGDLMWPGDPSTATCGPYSVDHRIKEILDDCFSSSYAARKRYVNSLLRNASEAELKKTQDGIEQWECNRLRDRLSLYVYQGEDIEYFLKKMKETPDHETSPDGTLHLWTFPTSGLRVVSQLQSHTRLVSPTDTKVENFTDNRVIEIGCQKAGKTYWFINPGKPMWQLNE